MIGKFFVVSTGDLPGLEKTLVSLGEVRKCARIIDNSLHGLPFDRNVIRPPVPLTFVQTMNWLQRLGRGSDYFCVMSEGYHFADPKELTSFLDYITCHREKWGLIFSPNRECCTINVDASLHVGNWDTNLPTGYAGYDFYYRMRQCGYVTENIPYTPLPHHDLYYSKWGGTPLREAYRLPFNGTTTKEWLKSLRATQIFCDLTTSYESSEGNLLAITDDCTACAQVEFMDSLLRMAKPADRPIRVLETGTNKGMFGVYLSLRGGGELWTHDCDPHTEKIAQILQSRLSNLEVHYRLGPSSETLDRLMPGYFDFFWVDGAHDYKGALADLEHAKRLQIPIVAIDDTNEPPVHCAIKQAFDASPYVEITNGYHDMDRRKMKAFRRKT